MQVSIDPDLSQRFIISILPERSREDLQELFADMRDAPARSAITMLRTFVEQYSDTRDSWGPALAGIVMGYAIARASADPEFKAFGEEYWARLSRGGVACEH